MKSLSTFIINSVCIAFLIPCTLWCIISSFDINANFVLMFMFSIVFTTFFSLICYYIENNKRFTITYIIIFVVALLFLWIAANTLQLQFKDTLNTILIEYSKYMPVPSGYVMNHISNVNLLFLYIEFILCMMYSFFLHKTKTNMPVILLTLLLMIPSFVLINTLPSLPALFVVLAITLSFYLTADIHRYNSKQSGIISMICAVSLLLLLICVYIASPIEKYERKEWQDNLLETIEQISSGNTGGNSDLLNRKQKIAHTLVQETDLSNAGPIQQTHELVMQVTNNTCLYEQEMYLRGTAYANFSENKWSILSDDQLKNYPDNFNTFNLTSVSAEEQRIRIITKDYHDLYYTPYYLSSEKISFQPLADICIPNDDYKKSYTMNYKPFKGTLLTLNTYNEEYKEYVDFVHNNYLGISDDLRTKLYNIGFNKGIVAGQDTQIIVQGVKNLVQNSATYSLNTPAVPRDKELPLWLLTSDTKTGYCVHFATTAAMMLRAYNIPTRYVTGYYASIEFGENDITTDNAHAWVEYFDENYGWIPLEATPSSFQPAQLNHKYDSLTNEPSTSATQASTSASSSTTAPTTKPTESKDKDNKSNTKVEPLTIVFAVVITLICLLVLRIIIIHIVRKKRFINGSNRKRARYIFRYIVLCHKFLITEIPDDIYTSGTKARFSKHTPSDDELIALLDYAKECKNTLYDSNNIFKRLFYKLIIVI
ncbi:MAG: transglutaminaseTgpA domain-containing protein [Ruminococcus sp.]|nr:transglutaminaseTgpA domain-containing protein [Ruminococcus sp.]